MDDLYSLRGVATDIGYFIDEEVNTLTDINLAGSRSCSFQAFNYISRNCENIVNINLNRCCWLTHELFETIILKNCKTIQSISLGYCVNLNNCSLQPVIINCKKLRKLKLSNNFWLSSGKLLNNLVYPHWNETLFLFTLYLRLCTNNCISSDKFAGSWLEKLSNVEWQIHWIAIEKLKTAPCSITCK